MGLALCIQCVVNTVIENEQATTNKMKSENDFQITFNYIY